MRLIVGLGNPGRKYKNTRHNVGFMVIDALEAQKVDDVMLAKPQTFMNNSGLGVKKLMANSKWPMDDLYVVHDDLDIPLGKYKIQKGRGPKEHGGVTSVERELGRKDFWRIRIGVENRKDDIAGDEYVLSDFSVEERQVINEVIESICQALSQ